MKFATLFTLKLVRAGTGEMPLPPDLAVLQPSARHPLGVRALARHRLLVRPDTDGLRVLLPLAEDSTPFITFDSLSLWFELHQKRADFACTMDLNALHAGRPAIFRSKPGVSTLGLDKQPGDATSVPNGKPPLAWVELRGLTDRDWQAPRRFLLELSPRQVRWVYYIITDRLDRIPSISDADTTRAFDFELTAFPASAPTSLNDRVAEALIATHPQAKVYRLHSKRSPPADGLPVKGLRLQLADQTCINNLAPPPADQWMAWPVPSNPQQTALYSVIRL